MWIIGGLEMIYKTIFLYQMTTTVVGWLDTELLHRLSANSHMPVTYMCCVSEEQTHG